MFRLLQTTTLAGIAVALLACSESRPTAPEAARAAATRDVVASSATSVTASCTVTTDGSSYTATVTWSGLTATSLDFLNGTALLARSIFDHPVRNGSVTLTLNTAPTVAELIGRPLGVKMPCNLVS